MKRPCALRRTPTGRVTCELEWGHPGAHVGRAVNRRKFVWWQTCGGVRPVPIGRVSEYLQPSEAIDLIARAMEELAVAEAFKMIHHDRAEQVYIQHGGRVRFHEGEAVMLWSADIIGESVFAGEGSP